MLLRHHGLLLKHGKCSERTIRLLFLKKSALAHVNAADIFRKFNCRNRNDFLIRLCLRMIFNMSKSQMSHRLCQYASTA